MGTIVGDANPLLHKLMVIDEQIGVAVSFDYTRPANDYNDENRFVIGSVFPKVGNIEVDLSECQALAKHGKAEIERVIAGSKKYTPRSPDGHDLTSPRWP